MSLMLVLLMLLPYTGFSAAAEAPADGEELVEEKHEHQYEYVGTQAADCTEHGCILYACACGDCISEDIQEPLGHDWVPEVTQEDEDLVRYVCTRCEAEKTENIRAAGESAEQEILTSEEAEAEEAETVPAEEWIGEEPQTADEKIPETDENAFPEETEADIGAVSILGADGVFPEGAVLRVTRAELPAPNVSDTVAFESGEAPEETDMAKLVYDEAIPDGDELLLVNPRSADADYSVTHELAAAYCYEISMISAEGEALQPGEGQGVTLAFDLPEAEDESLSVRVLHYPADGTAEELPARVEDGTVYAETTGFSVFVVEFRCDRYRHSITSGHPANVQIIAENVLKDFIGKYPCVVEAVSKDPASLYVSHVNGIWEVEALRFTDKPVELVITLGNEDGRPAGEFPVWVDMREPTKIKYKTYNDKLLEEIKVCDSFTPLSSLRDVMGVTLKDGWYVVDQNVTFAEHRLTVLGDVHLILRDGCTLTCNWGIRTAVGVDPRTTLSVYAEDLGTGRLNVEYKSKPSRFAGIGGNDREDGGVVNIYGGMITVRGACYGARIGGGLKGNLRGFTMYAGEVDATGVYGAGIGGGDSGTITGPIVIHGGTVKAFSDTTEDNPENQAAGIGAGRYANLGADIVINGGLVIAHGTTGPGIGDTGEAMNLKRINDSGFVNINGGHVIAYADNGAGIGCAAGGIACTVNIRDGFVEAVSTKKGAGIGGGYAGWGGVVNISGGTVIARGTDLDIPFGRAHKWVTVEKQNREARAVLEVVANLIMEAFERHEYGGAGIGGDGGSGGTVTITGGKVLPHPAHQGLSPSGAG